MAFEDFKKKDSVVIVYTGDGKGKTSASLGLLARALGSGYRVAFIQFIKYWDVSEHSFLKAISDTYSEELTFYKGGKGFFDAGELSAGGVTDEEHRGAAQKTLAFALETAASGDFDVVICDEINNALHDGLIDLLDVKELITARDASTSVCLTGRNFPEKLLPLVDIATDMTKIKHHFDEEYIANKGIDY